MFLKSSSTGGEEEGGRVSGWEASSIGEEEGDAAIPIVFCTACSLGLDVLHSWLHHPVVVCVLGLGVTQKRSLCVLYMAYQHMSIHSHAIMGDHLLVIYHRFLICSGRYMYKGGKLVATSLDLYLALEYCDQGEPGSSRSHSCSPVTLCVTSSLVSGS